MTDIDKSIRTITGLVLSTKTDKTITVKVTRQVKHPLYGKFIKKSSKFHAHDENNLCSEGDVVSLVSCRPISKTKTWKLNEILEKTK